MQTIRAGTIEVGLIISKQELNRELTALKTQIKAATGEVQSLARTDISRTRKDLHNLTPQRAPGFFKDVKRQIIDVKAETINLDQTFGRLQQTMLAIAGGSVVVGIGKSLVDSAQKVDVLESRLNALGSGRGIKGFERLLSLSNKLGVSYNGLSDQYLSFANALNRTELRGQTDELFQSLSLATQGLDQTQVDSYFRALTQVLGKGKLLAEEYTNQLGEIPGIADAIRESFGFVNKGEFLEAISTGGIKGKDVLTNLASELELTRGVVENANTSNARFENSLEALKVASGEAIAPAYMVGLKSATGLMNLASNNTELLSTGVQTLAIYMAGQGLLSLKAYVVGLGGASVAANKLTASLLATAKVTAPILGLVGVFNLWRDAIDSVNSGSEGVQRHVEQSKRAMAEYEATIRGVSEAASAPGSVLSENFWTGWADAAINSMNRAQRALNRLTGANENDNTLTTFGDIERDRDFEALEGQLQRLSQARGQLDKSDRGSIKLLNTQIQSTENLIETLRARAASDPSYLTGSFKDDLENAESFTQSIANNFEGVTKEAKAAGNEFRSIADQSKELTDQLKQQNSLIQRQGAIAKTNLNQRFLNGQLTPVQFAQAKQSLDLRNLENQARSQREQLEALQNVTINTDGLKPAEIEQQKRDLKQKIDDLTDSYAQTNEAISEAQIEIKEATERQAQEYLETSEELQRTLVSYFQGLEDTQRTIRDQLDREIQNLEDSVQELQSQTYLANLDSSLSSAIAPLKKTLMDTGSDLVKNLVGGVVDIMEQLNDQARRRIENEARRQQYKRTIRDIQLQQAGVIQGLDQTVRQSNQNRISTMLGASNPSIGQISKSGLINPVQGIWNAEGGYDADSGLDLIVPEGTKAVASASGNLIYAERGHSAWMHEDASATMPGFQPQQSILVELDQPFEYSGKLIRYMWYTHLQAIEDNIKNKGSDRGLPTRIEAGQILGEIGKANNVPHLHFGLLSDRRQRHEGDWLGHKQVRDILYGSGGGLNLTPRQPVTRAGGRSVNGESNITRYLRRIAAGESNEGRNIGPNHIGAYGEYQFIPETRASVKRLYGHDAWSSNKAERDKAAIALIQDVEKQLGQSILSVIRRGDFNTADRLLGQGAHMPGGFGTFTSLPGGDEAHRMWSDPANLTKFGPVNNGGIKAETIYQSPEIRARRSSIQLPGLDAPDYGPLNQATEEAIAAHNQLNQAREAQFQREQQLSEVQIEYSRRQQAQAIEDQLAQYERLNGADRQLAILAESYRGLPDELIPRQFANAPNLSDLEDRERLQQTSREISTLVDDLDRLRADLEAMGQDPEAFGISPDRLNQLKEEAIWQQANLKNQQLEIDKAMQLKEAYAQIQAERERGDRDNSAIQDLLSNELSLQDQLYEQLVRQGQIWDANAVKRKQATAEIDNQLQQELRRIEILRQELQFGVDNGFTEEQLDELSRIANESAQITKDAISDQYRDFKGTVLDSNREALRATLGDLRSLISESKSFGGFLDSFLDRLITRMGDALISLGSNFLTDGLFGILGGKKKSSGGDFLSGLFGVGTSLLGGLGGSATGFSIGSIVPSGFGTLHDGGLIKNYARGGMAGLGYELMSAMKREKAASGRQPVPIVAHEGEGILNLRGMAAIGGEYGLNKINKGFRIPTFDSGGIVKPPTFDSGGILKREHAPSFDRPNYEPGNEEINIKLETEARNGEEYITREQAYSLAQQAAKQGRDMAFKKIRGSVNTRNFLGI